MVLSGRCLGVQTKIDQVFNSSFKSPPKSSQEKTKNYHPDTHEDDGVVFVYLIYIFKVRTGLLIEDLPSVFNPNNC